MKRFTAFFFALYLVVLTFPGYEPFNRIDPRVLGLPFSLVWVVLWVILGWAMLAALYRSERNRGGE